ncbi:MAG: S8 family serine peptidase [Planctomycetes bacterium]|nr:S8 family serine peptidase [Planctomycetota bacterium]
MRFSTPVLLLLMILNSAAGVRAEDPPVGDGFPGLGLLPKRETGALRLLKAHPTFDGRGVKVAIFDTGVDPGAPGLQVTSDGRPKIVDLIDASGSGDVDTSVTREADGSYLTGLSGRKLKLGAEWNNPSGKYHIGLKRAYELYPGRLVNRVKRKRREKWDERQRVLVTELKRRIEAWDAENAKPSGEKKKERDDLETRVEQLDAMQAKYDDPGPIFDCVVFHDGQVWRAAIDTDEDGDLGDEALLTNFRLERQYATFSELDLLNFGINIYDDGNLLSIVADAGAHGTHVAGIVAANFPDQPELNGVAPGAQIVSVKIGDTRLGSTSVGTGEVRGLIAVLQNKCDLINMSYGGPTADPNDGRLSKLYSEIVNKHGVIFVASAGNNGPALSTVGGPGGTTSAIFGVGAYVSPEMMAAQYSLRKTLPEILYTWSSRGPTYDGDIGVNFSAPGGAIAPVPNWSLQRNMLMNGTSMASPNLCGGVALLLSGLKQEGMAYSPHRIRRAIENTARWIDNVEPFAQGRGLAQYDKALDYLIAFAEHEDQDIRFEVSLPRRGGARGVYLREPNETRHPFETTVRVNPIFHEDADNRRKVAFEKRITLEATAPWIRAPSHLMLMHNGRTFEIRIDATDLDHGVHYGEVQGFDSQSPERGPLFRVPVTVIRPQRIDRGDDCAWREDMELRPGQIERRFVAVPSGATWADLRIRARHDEGRRRLVMHVLQKVPGDAYDATQLKQRIWMTPGQEAVRSFKVAAGRTLELCLAQYWSSLGTGEFEFELNFHGLTPSNRHVQIDGSRLVTRVDIESPLGRETVSPSASLTTLRQSIRPSDHKIRPLLSERDALPGRRQIFELVLTYEFTMDKAGSVTPVVAMIDEHEYADTWESQIWMLFDSAKRRIAVGTLDPKKLKLEKGDYVLRFHVRQDSADQLEKLIDMPLLLDRALAKPVALTIYPDPDHALTGGAKFGSRTMTAGERVALYIASPDVAKLPKGAKPGDLLLGSISYGQPNASLTGAGKRPGGFNLTYHVPPPAGAKKSAATVKKDDRTEAVKLAESLRDLKVARLGRLHSEKNAETFEMLAEEILAEHPDHLPVFVARLKRLDDQKRDEHLPAVVQAAGAVLKRIDTAALAAHYGVNLDSDDADAIELREEMDVAKAILVDTLYRKGRALAFTLDGGEAGSGRTKEAAAKADADEETDGLIAEFERTFAELRKWVDTTDDKYVLLHIRREKRHGRLGNAIELLNRHLAQAKPRKMLFEKRIKLLNELGWAHWRDYEKKWLLLRMPKEYPPF